MSKPKIFPFQFIVGQIIDVQDQIFDNCFEYTIDINRNYNIRINSFVQLNINDFCIVVLLSKQKAMILNIRLLHTNPLHWIPFQLIQPTQDLIGEFIQPEGYTVNQNPQNQSVWEKQLKFFSIVNRNLYYKNILLTVNNSPITINVEEHQEFKINYTFSVNDGNIIQQRIN